VPPPFNLANPRPEMSFLSGFLDLPIGAFDIMTPRCLIKFLLFERPVRRSPRRLCCRTPSRGRTPGPGGCGSSQRWSEQRRPSRRVVMKEAAARPRRKGRSPRPPRGRRRDGRHPARAS
jgi:hypothetical protein